MYGSGTSHKPLDGCETIVRDYLAQGQGTLPLGVLIRRVSSVRSGADVGYGTRSVGSTSTNENSWCCGIWRTSRMTRLPVSSTSAGGRSNAISRVPKPSFATPMKGVTRMLYPHDEPPWTPQHSRALFRLFQTSAPTDFQRQLLERVAQHQATHGLRRLGWRSLLAWWPGYRAWGVGTSQRHRRWPSHGITVVGCCGLVLGNCLAWWAARTGPTAPPTPALLVSRAIQQAPG